MKYMGSKRRIFPSFKEIIKSNLTDQSTYIEPFVGGGNSIIQIEHRKRIGYDINPYTIEALKLIRDYPESIPDIITEDYYAKLNKEREVNGITGFAAFAMSFGGRFFEGYRRDKAGSKGDIQNMKTQSMRSKKDAMKQSDLLKGVDLITGSYCDINMPDKSVIYCDPPYQNTKKYTTSVKFNHFQFFTWCERMAADGHTVFVSEYDAPKSFTVVWEGEMSNNLSRTRSNSTIVIEKLFTIK
jgi:DNA adenine methylase